MALNHIATVTTALLSLAFVVGIDGDQKVDYSRSWCTKEDRSTPDPDRNGEMCYVFENGYNEERMWQQGTCQDGKCIIKNIPLGCTKEEQPPASSDGLQIGCTFICSRRTEGGDHDIEQYYGFYPPDTACRHMVNESSYIETTCKRSGPGNKTICRQAVPDVLGC
ncbi:uncharacterized protein LOC144137649 [Haemaphysalis longicornis]